ncbi:MAG: YibE/F family protein [Actinomycetota bacterium]
MTLIGFFLLRPTDVPDLSGAVQLPTNLVDGTVIRTFPSACPGLEDGSLDCRNAQVRLTEGPNEGEIVSFEVSDYSSIRTISAGDRIVVSYTPDAPEEFAYDFADMQRNTPMLVLAGIFAVAVIGLGRLKGLTALFGFVISLAIIAQFVLPSILSGHSPLAVAVVGSAGIMFISLYLSHGFNARTTTAVLGTLASLSITGVLAYVFVEVTSLTGFASEEAIFIRVASDAINVQGLLLGGIIIGSLGVLDDVTITQSSAVWELHLANPSLSRFDLYRAAIRIGRDHIASTVNTLVLAYAGAALPLLILFTISGSRLHDVLTGEIVAEEVVRTLVGSIGLVASVPITTALTALVVSTVGSERSATPAES